ncbi:uncharacterized protein DSM5745_09859 [Aspergillus mulundensis]|uniref:Rhodopsin domain-containing protein n=1 Tax=Aspergillus mulundensis TaxID=1810919 RepID=A0A3D8QRZ6_9EURO|nr:hypothetical protein DSM5745_09859 [Aspergillus mulundensis]RDW64448.1 hypothetical protein DSM5745_09859 [Aspergillus mulundensis]
MADVENRGWVLYAVSWPLFGLALLIIALRLWVRARIVRSVGWDDAFIILAFVCALINTVLVTISVEYGTGRHASDLTENQRIQSMKYQVLSAGFHVMSTNWGKVSVALFLIRIISEVKNHKRGMYALIGVMSAINLGAVITIYAQCQPTAVIWDHRLAGPEACWPPGTQKNYSFFQGGMFSQLGVYVMMSDAGADCDVAASAFTDLILAVYPLFTIKDLQMATKVKVGLGFVLSLGLVAMVAAIIKATHLPDMTSYEDYTWATVDLTIWVSLEQYIIILAACIPALTPLFNIIIRRASNRSKSKSKSRSKSNELIPNAAGGDGTKRSSYKRHLRHSSRSKGLSRDFVLDIDSNASSSQHQSYNPFASVGREYVEYPLTWTNLQPPQQGDLASITSGSESELHVPEAIPSAEAESGILRTTEFRIKAVSSERYSHYRAG